MSSGLPALPFLVLVGREPTAQEAMFVLVPLTEERVRCWITLADRARAFGESEADFAYLGFADPDVRLLPVFGEQGYRAPPAASLKVPWSATVSKKTKYALVDLASSDTTDWHAIPCQAFVEGTRSGEVRWAASRGRGAVNLPAVSSAYLSRFLCRVAPDPQLQQAFPPIAAADPELAWSLVEHGVQLAGEAAVVHRPLLDSLDRESRRRLAAALLASDDRELRQRVIARLSDAV